MNQIPNIEEVKDFPELEKQYVAMWDKGEFEWNHHEGDKLGKKPISVWRIWTTFIKPTLHHQLQKAREEEQWRIWKQLAELADDGEDSFISAGDLNTHLDDVHKIIFIKDHSELDQPNK